MLYPYESIEERVGLLNNKTNHVVSDSGPKILSYSKYITAGFLMIGVVFGLTNGLRFSIGYNLRTIFDVAEDFNIQVSVTNVNYPDGIQSVKSGMIPWSEIAEPYKEHIAHIKEFKIKGALQNIDNFNVEWLINGMSYSGNSALFKIAGTTGLYRSFVKITDKITGFEYSSEFSIMLKYVRREIRSLTESDRKAYFDALYTMYTTDDVTGQSLYGEKFHSAAWYSHAHLAGAGTTDCDHWHDGAGIVPHHIGITLAVEQTLQSINPAVSIVYWEYSLDNYLYEDWQQSPVFNSDWFGENMPRNEMHEVSEGMWSKINIPDGSSYTNWDISSSGSLNPFVNSYGQLRSPWNNNPSQKITRYNSTYGSSTYSSTPACFTLNKCYSSSKLSDMNDCINGATHGPVHIIIGGAWDKEDNFYDPLYDTDLAFLDSTKRVLFFKMMWRQGYTRCPITCTVGTPCLCAVPSVFLEKVGPYKILEDIGFFDYYSSYETSDIATLTLIVRRLEDPGAVGEMLTSSASFDPTFWPLHGTIERILGLKRIQLKLGKVEFDETWGYPTSTKEIALRGRCDWSVVKSAEDLTLPVCSTEAVCWGHQADDRLEFGNFLNKNDHYTNSEFYTFVDPWNEDLPYIYDTYDFEYCETYADISFTSTSSTDPRLELENIGSAM